MESKKENSKNNPGMLPKNKFRAPRVENKYNLTCSSIKKLRVGDRSKITEHLFWRNNVIDAWCITGRAGGDVDGDEFWLGIYDENAKAYAGKFRFDFSSWGGMCSYNFEKFFQPEDLEFPIDLVIQEKFLEKINELIDMGVLIIQE